MKHGDFKVSDVFVSDDYQTSTIARYLLICIKYIETVLDFKNPKTCMLIPYAR